MADTLKYDCALKYLAKPIADLLKGIPNNIKENTYEIRLRNERPVSIVGAYGSLFIDKNFNVCKSCEGAVKASCEDLRETFNKLCSYSVYSYQRDINRGFIPMENGNRAGVCGTAVCENESIHSVKDITSLNIRIAHEIKGCADEIIKRTDGLNGSYIIAGPPAGGKTTVIRDIVRQISGDRYGCKKTAVIDERCEISGACGGKITNNIGVTSDIFISYPKAEAIDIAVRAFSPEFIVCDEISTDEEISAVKSGLSCGVNFILTVHCGSVEELFYRRQIYSLISTHSFKKLFLLGKGENIGKITEEFIAEEILSEIDSRKRSGIYDSLYSHR